MYRSGRSQLRHIKMCAAPRRGCASSSASGAVHLRDKRTGKEWVIQPRSRPATTAGLAALLGCAITPMGAIWLAPQAAGLAAVATPGVQYELCAAISGPAAELGDAVAPAASEAFAGLVAPWAGELEAAIGPMMLECTAATAGGHASTAIASAVTQNLVRRR